VGATGQQWRAVQRQSTFMRSVTDQLLGGLAAPAERGAPESPVGVVQLSLA